MTLYKIVVSLWKNQENDAAEWLLLAILDKLTMDTNELCDKVHPLLASQNTVKSNNELSGKIDQLPMCINSLKVSKCARQENLLSSIQLWKIKLKAELQQKFKSPSCKVLAVKVSVLICKEWDPVS